MLKSLQIDGLRGFASSQTQPFGIATGVPGSGLTVIVGANNAGKSTVVEALRAIAQREPPSITQGRRNRAAGDRVRLRVTTHTGLVATLESLSPGTSETRRDGDARTELEQRTLVLPSRRTFNPYFGRSTSPRETYMGQMGFPNLRQATVDPFVYRLFRAHEHKTSFNVVLAKVMNPVPEWTIDQADTGQHFLKLTRGEVTHSSEGLGEGLVSLLFIVDALYDSNPGDTIVVDEPELSLHPALQRRLSSLLVEYSADRQIIIATHSPYFVPLAALEAGAVVSRVHLLDENATISTLKPVTGAALAGLLKDTNNPHTLGLNAQEVFFLGDRIILTEGQEDVVYYERVQANLGVLLEGSFFGWGVGGVHNMPKIAAVLSDLGFRKVVGILDGNHGSDVADLKDAFPAYHFFAIPADDVRTKKAVVGRPKLDGLLDDTNQNVRPQHAVHTKQLFDAANLYMIS